MKAIDTEQFKNLVERAEQLTVVNTLAAEHFAETRIPRSVNIPQEDDDFVRRVEKAAGGRDRPVVVYCASQQCDSSTRAAQKLDAAGFKEVYDYEGGASAWQQAGEPQQAS